MKFGQSKLLYGITNVVKHKNVKTVHSDDFLGVNCFFKIITGMFRFHSFALLRNWDLS